jgi:heme/copper-type cytochrome/quinol oxidase subunit 1
MIITNFSLNNISRSSSIHKNEGSNLLSFRSLRRISDYPDGFAGWNLISSFGSIISVVTSAIFLFTLYKQLVNGKALIRNMWSYPQHFMDYLQLLLGKAYDSIEWCLQSPPNLNGIRSKTCRISIYWIRNDMYFSIFLIFYTIYAID